MGLAYGRDGHSLGPEGCVGEKGVDLSGCHDSQHLLAWATVGKPSESLMAARIVWRKLPLELGAWEHRVPWNCLSSSGEDQLRDFLEQLGRQSYNQDKAFVL